MASKITRDDRIGGREWIIFCCKDGTFTYGRVGARKKIPASLPIFSVRTEEEAQRLQKMFCFEVNGVHPLIRKEQWYKFNDVLSTGLTSTDLAGNEGCPVFDVDHLDLLMNKLAIMYEAHVKPKLPQLEATLAILALHAAQDSFSQARSFWAGHRGEQDPERASASIEEKGLVYAAALAQVCEIGGRYARSVTVTKRKSSRGRNPAGH